MHIQVILWLCCVLFNAYGQIPEEACVHYSKPGDISIGAVLQMRRNRPTPCQGGISTLGILYSEALIFAIDNINNRTDLLPNITLGYDIRDSCTSEDVALWSAMSLFTDPCLIYNNSKSQPNIIGFIAGGSSSKSLFTAKVANLYKVPMISWAATSDELSDSSRFPYFLRSVSPNRLQVGAIIDVLLKYRWLYVTLVYSEDPYGINGARTFKYLAESKDICIALSVSMSIKPSQTEIDLFIDKQLKVPKSKVIVIFASSESGIGSLLIRNMKEKNMYLNITFIGSDGWGYDIEKSSVADYVVGSFFVRDQRPIDKDFMRSFNQFNPITAKTPWAKEYWENCESDPYCPFLVFVLSYMGSYIMLCIDIFVQALESILKELQSSSVSQEMKSLSRNITGEMLLPHLYGVELNTSIGTFRFDEIGDALGRYSILNVQAGDDGHAMAEVGTWDAKEINNALNIDNIQFADRSYEPTYSLCAEFCDPGYVVVPLELNCCYGCQKCPNNAIVVNDTQCEPCSITTWPDEQFKICLDIIPTFIELKDPVIITMMLLGALGLVGCTLAGIGMFNYRNHALIKATSKELSGINLFGLFLAFISVFVLLARPSSITCSFEESIISLSFTTMFTPTLLKVVRIYRIFQAGNKTAKRPRFVGIRDQIAFSTLLISLQVIYNFVFCCSAPLREKNAVSAFQISCKLLFFYLGRFMKKLADDQYSSVTKGSTSIYYIKYVQTTFYY